MAKKSSKKPMPKKAAPKKTSTKKPTKAPPSKISQAEYDKMTSSGYMFAARELNSDAVRANKRANMYMTPGMGLGGRRTAKGPPPRPMNPNATYRMNPKKGKK